VHNNSDSCTSIPAVAILRSNYLDYKGAPVTLANTWTTTPSAVAISSGNGTLTLSAPSPSYSGSVEFAFNLGSTTTDQSCLANHPTGTGAGAAVPWLRSQYGTSSTCASQTGFDRDPSAKATFGVYQPESKKIVYSRDLF
jgi:MSHA biogenesis protein MshQ